MTDTLTTTAERDGFTTESPIRAFTEFRVDGLYAMGKGFRPSLAHLTTYLDAMQRRENWQMVQIILPDNDAADPSVMFRRCAPMLTLDAPVSVQATTERDTWPYGAPLAPIRVPYMKPGVGLVPIDDPINPAHYDGTACADIGELLTPNAYQVLKYCWRLGKKDDPVVELGKAIWYAEREVFLLRENGPALLDIRQSDPWFYDRIAHQPGFTKSVAIELWDGYNKGMTVDMMLRLLSRIHTHKGQIESAPGSAL